MPHVPPRRVPKQKRSRERYDHILDVAANLFFEKGFGPTTTNEIARTAGVSIGSLYQYFDNKTAVVEALRDRYLDGLHQVTQEVLAEDVAELPVPEVVDRILDPLVDFHSSNPALGRLWAGSEASRELRSAMRTMDKDVMSKVGELVSRRIRGLTDAREEALTIVVGSTAKSLLGLLGRIEDVGTRRLVVAETKTMLVVYLESVMRGPS